MNTEKANASASENCKGETVCDAKRASSKQEADYSSVSQPL